MQSALLAARLLLAAVFLAAALGKLLDRGGSRRALIEFGAPPSVATLGSVVLPLVELAIAASLVISTSAFAGAVAAAALLLAFVAAIVNALAHNRAPDCHCFGQLHTAPAGIKTVSRNVFLLALAAFVATKGPGPALDAWIARRTTDQLVLSAAIVVVALSAVGATLWLERRRRRLIDAEVENILQRPSIPVGSPAPRFALPGACGPSLSLDSLCGRDRPVMVVFADPDCCACQPLLRHLGRWQQTLADQLTITVISNDDAAASRMLCERYGISGVLLQSDFEISNAYRTHGTPSAVIVGSDGAICSDTATGFQMIQALVRVVQRRPIASDTPRPVSPQLA